MDSTDRVRLPKFTTAATCKLSSTATAVATFPPEAASAPSVGVPPAKLMNCTLFCVLILLPEVFKPASVTTTYPATESTAIPLGAEFAGSEIVGGFTDGWPDEVNGLLPRSVGGFWSL